MMRKNLLRGFGVVGALVLVAGWGLLVPPGTARADHKGKPHGGGGGGGGKKQEIPVSVEFRDDGADRVRSDGGGIYVTNGREKSKVFIGQGGQLRMGTGRTRSVFLDTTVRFDGGGCGPSSFAQLVSVNLVTLGEGSNADAKLTDAQLALGGSTERPDRLDLTAMTPGQMTFVGLRLNFTDPITGEGWSLSFADRESDPDDNHAQLVSIVGGDDVDGDGFSDSWVIEAGPDDFAVAWRRGGIDQRFPLCGFFSLPFLIEVVKD